MAPALAHQEGHQDHRGPRSPWGHPPHAGLWGPGPGNAHLTPSMTILRPRVSNLKHESELGIWKAAGQLRPAGGRGTGFHE